MGVSSVEIAAESPTDIVLAVSQGAVIRGMGMIREASPDITRVPTRKRAGIGIRMFSVPGLMGFFGFAVLLATFVLLLDLVLPAWAAALIVAVVLFAIAGIAALLGKKKVSEVGSPTPERAMTGLKKDIATVKGERR